jgi:hypothetical protein
VEQIDLCIEVPEAVRNLLAAQTLLALLALGRTRLEGIQDWLKIPSRRTDSKTPTLICPQQKNHSHFQVTPSAMFKKSILVSPESSQKFTH